MTLILITIALGMVLLILWAISAPRLPEGHHKPGRLIVTRYIPSSEYVGEEME
jgi:hypothetical protein